MEQTHFHIRYCTFAIYRKRYLAFNNPSGRLDRKLTYAVVGITIATILLYSWGLFFSDSSDNVVRITLLVIVLSIVTIVGAIFAAMAFSYPITSQSKKS